MKPLSFPISILLFFNLACAQEVEVRVLDDSGNAVGEATVIVNYISYDVKQDLQLEGRSDKNGIFVANAKAPLRIEVLVKKDGFYSTKSGRLSRHADHEITLQLRKIENPVSMYSKTVSLQVPKLGKFFAFDFEVGDWVDPYGEGNNTDLLIKAEKRVDGPRDYEGILYLEFPDQSEGLIEDPNWYPLSEFCSSRIAPDSGYSNSEAIRRSHIPNVGYKNSDMKNYLMKIRIKRDENGKIVSQNYGKIYGGIDALVGLMDPEIFGIKFTYYYNPTPNDRNLEFDPEKNLFDDLKHIEKVYKP